MTLVISGFLFFVFEYTYADQQFEDYYQKGHQAYQSRDYAVAIDYYNQAIKIDPNSAEAYYSLGTVYRDQGSPIEEIVWFFQVATEINSEHFDAHQTLGKLYLQVEQFDLAEKHLMQAAELQSNRMDVQFSLAWLYLNGKADPSKAIYYFNKVLEKREIPKAYYGLGLAYARAGEKAMSLDTITKLREKGENELAARLEDLIREPYQLQPEPSAPAPFVARPPTDPTPAQGLMRVRLRGKLFNIDGQDNP